MHTTSSAKEANSSANSTLSLVRAPSTVITSTPSSASRRAIGKHHRRADAAGHADRGAFGDEIARPTERTDDVVDLVAGGERHEIGRALADRLDDEHDRALVGVAVGDRERDAFRAGTEPNDHELTGLARPRRRGEL